MADKQRRDELIRLFDQMGEAVQPGNFAAEWSQRLREDKCPICGNEIKEADFRDDLSRREFALSHICQKCQDLTFVEPKE